MKQARQRIDQLLCDRGLVESQDKARAMLLAGAVMVNGQRVDKAGALVPTGAVIELIARMPWVSRGAYKLLGALDHWKIDVTGRVCLDVGSSTGGFTDVLLHRGALRVHCVDVGAGQLDWKLRNDPRVVVHEGVNARFLEPALTGEPAGLAVCDVSFISVTLILPALKPMLAAPREFVVLVKPQFEVGRDQVGRGGIVRDPALHQTSVERVRSAAAMLDFETEVIESPVLGAEGNKEFLLYGTDSHGRHHLEA
ncbi:TlyA family RNA methyltransferase [Paludibaculum fermentans]|uniref:TlyA family RNA methyltransferase n=1 Tax=Paludibaculum fermentans TaxID=1473598 RepID=UPI003EBD71A9